MRILQSSDIFYHHNFIYILFVLQQMPSIGENFIDPEAAAAAKEQAKQERRERKEKRRKEREARREARQKERERLRLLKEEMEKKQEEEKQSSDTEDEVLIRVRSSLISLYNMLYLSLWFPVQYSFSALWKKDGQS